MTFGSLFIQPSEGGPTFPSTDKWPPSRESSSLAPVQLRTVDTLSSGEPLKGLYKGYDSRDLKTLAELLATEDPAWPEVRQWIRDAVVPVEVLPPSHAAREAGLEWLQVTTRSALGAVAWETGGLLVDHGWLRVLGSGHPRLPRSLLDWNRGRTFTGESAVRTHVLVADDVVGGLFAVGCGEGGFKGGEITYCSPDTLRWESLGMGYSEFLRSTFSGRLAEFSAEYRWDGWEKEVEALGGDRAISLVPPPFMKGEPFARRSRAAVPMAEHYGLYQEFAQQLKDVPDGSKIVLRIKPT